MSEIRVIATDMDGTFLKNDNSYDRERFSRLIDKMNENDIKFLVASANQYEQLKTYFTDFHDNIYYIAENGTIIYKDDEVLHSTKFPEELAEEVFDFIVNEIGYYPLLASENVGYLHESFPDEIWKFTSKYYFNLKPFGSKEDLPFDNTLKYALGMPGMDIDAILIKLKEKFGDNIVVASSGDMTLMISAPGSGKKESIKHLLESWDLNEDNLLVFGDSDNDIEMIEYAKYGYAMENANANAKKVAKYIAPRNEDSGVLKTIEEILEM